ncbi:MAG: IS4 family transposase, partial [Phycisphaerae bacterium]|nr:IS4 family transposase [Phycisphaerae bacterium]NIX27320.1 IS4 family transposase [Phycisphaerae bacterium]
QLASFLFGLFAQQGKVYLSMDRTNWQWGKSPINILMLSLVYKGTAIPIFWAMVPTNGNSSTFTRIALMNRFIKQFGAKRIAGLLCDREFVGKEWFNYLKTAQIPFYIRIKSNTMATNSKGQTVGVWRLFLELKYREQRVLRGARHVYGIRVFLVGVRCDDGEQLIVASSEENQDAIGVYRLRWEIETLFGCLKSRGFHFEDTHITDPERIQKLVGVLAIAFAWSHRVGEWRHEHSEPIKVKKHGRLAKSLFRHGLDFIREILFVGKFSMARFRQCLAQLTPSPQKQKAILA